ncbi:hypothetical protein LLE49_10895 [Alicyclobacillus tolerans]|uniref:hypothetical protein n=1 Tax=Alicyclobacillus tolerans TaxID=90970 RepID=UPI001F32A7C4|nr:hypothetical protein [Alicyclobacillus tolerans]MCF8565221.1 hypothetical protein [Alicyclobacillus tolerans]
MRILAIGPSFEHESVTQDTFGSDTSLLDFDLLIFDPSTLIEEYWNKSKYNTYTGYPVIDDRNSVRLKMDIKRRQSEMYELLKQGRTVVVFTPPPLRCHILAEDRDYAADRMGMAKYDLHETLFTPILFTRYGRNVRTVEATGVSIEFRGDEPFASLWERNKGFLRYNAYFEEKVGKPQWYIEGTTKVLGTYLKIKNGHLIFLPAPRTKEEFDNAGEWSQAQHTFIESLENLVNELHKGLNTVQLPSWSLNYLLPGESEQRANLENLQSVLDHVHREIAQQKDQLDQLVKFKLLVAGAGKPFDVQIRTVFEELGFTVTDGLLGRDDILLTYGNKFAVVQSRSLSRNATITHAAQLEKCVSEYFTPHEIEVKGILVVNAFKDVALRERVEPAFPAAMVGYSEKRNHCLITGMQLLGLYLETRDDPVKKEEAIQKLFAANGLFQEEQDWSVLLTERAISVAASAGEA